MSFPDGLTPAQLLYPDLDNEIATTKKMLAAVPDGKNDWKPHDKSMSLGQLASHLAELPKFGTIMLQTEEMDFATAGWKPSSHESTEARLADFEKLAAEMKEHVNKASWEDLAKSWTLRSGEQVFLTQQKAPLIRSFAISHIAHHRAQLGVYLRLLGLVIPGSYGPSADEM